MFKVSVNKFKILKKTILLLQLRIKSIISMAGDERIELPTVVLEF